ncbi:MAG: 2-amino-4-hydroxy-6-hydroxymethyldihydropteridine diphosphokinase, partial [Candidatus Cloacimonadota bacterium]|nr:2-amino-4-hydroxy-6-hydroxymethyldihydropteridine diphosphokinase [Candidatus Cloacimonadota bacterium]
MKVYLGLGSNIGDRKKYIEAAKNLLDHNETKIIQESEIIETKPYGYTDQRNFFNQIIIVETKLGPLPLLELCQSLEHVLNRKREIHWGPRTIDIDILFYENKIIDTERLIIPHPEIQKREFILKSLMEIAPDLIHPVLKKTIRLIYEELKSKKDKKMYKVASIILAAGKGTRMKSEKPKVIFELAQKPMINRVINTAIKSGSSKIDIVVGYKKEIVKEVIGKNSKISYSFQKEQNGTGHAVMVTEENFTDFEGDIFILCGDVPLLRAATLKKMLIQHRKQKASCTVLTAIMDDALKYGRIVRNKFGNVDKIIEF